jgi:tryptophan-rich hypothetical protein
MPNFQGGLANLFATPIRKQQYLSLNKDDIMNAVNPKKLLNSKWTAVNPQNKEKHFIITEVEVDEFQNLYHCVIEAVMSKRSFTLQWRELRDANQWTCGWK